MYGIDHTYHSYSQRCLVHSNHSCSSGLAQRAPTHFRYFTYGDLENYKRDYPYYR